MLTYRKTILVLLASLALVMVATDVAGAGSPLGIGVAEPSFNSGGFLGGFLGWVNVRQQEFYRALTQAIEAMRADPWHLWALVGLSFAYGIFHAAGPGHGKAVISSYLIANEAALRRGVLLAFLSSFLQGMIAIAVVGVAFLALRGTGITLTDATWAMQTASFALVASFGAWLLWKKLFALMRRQPIAEPAVAGGVPFSAQGHDAFLARPVAAGDHDHAHHHHGPGEVCGTCGHAHAPDPALLKGEKLKLSEAWSAVLAVGLRPCSGALIVLTFAFLNRLYLGGFLSVLAMSVGTAITVSILATLAVTAKGLAVRVAGSGSAGIRVGTAIEIAGAALVMLLGLSLLAASFSG